MEKLFNILKSENPLVYSLTNDVTIESVAEIILAAGGSPIMGKEHLEAEELMDICDSLMVNIGTLNVEMAEAIVAAAKLANRYNKPIIVDPVGIGVSDFRRRYSLKFLEEIDIAVIKGNATEIKFLYSGLETTSGVDVDEMDIISEDNIHEYVEMAKALAKKYNTTIMVTGPIDVISDGTTTFLNRSGSPMFEYITGAGCMLGGVLGAVYGTGHTDIKSALLACVYFNAAGEMAEKYEGGPGTFRTKLFDYVYSSDFSDIKEYMNYELYRE